MTTTAEPDVISFGPSEVPSYKQVPIQFRYIRDDKVEVQRFNVIAKTMDIGAANRVMRMLTTAGASDVNDAQALAAMMTMIAKFMDDKDGTGSRWEAVELPPKKSEQHLPNPPKRFRGPDGRIYPWEERAQFMDPDSGPCQASGSSRRRWLHLMNKDDQAEVDVDALMSLMQFLMELAGKGPGHA